MAVELQSRAYYTGDGSNRNFTFNFPYIFRDHIKVSLNGVASGGYSWLSDYTIQFYDAPGPGAEIEIMRVTPRDKPIAQVSNGVSMRAEDLNRQALQAIYVAQEASDVAELMQSQTLKAPDTDAGRITLKFPSIEARAGYPLGFDMEGQFKLLTEDDMPKGKPGDKGPTGAQGPLGPTGPAGPTGPQGPRGDKGPLGDQGPVGIAGPQGPQGIPGITGPRGPEGIQGPQGPQGDEGPIGKSFEPDAQGLTADRSTWDAEPEGFSFLDIEQGIVYWKLSNEVANWSTGTNFGRGPTGIQGPQGPQGVKGETGDPGPTGPQGVQGPQGNTGPTGPEGPIGATGPEGPLGPTGPQGPQGPEGPKGENGPRIVHVDVDFDDYAQNGDQDGMSVIGDIMYDSVTGQVAQVLSPGDTGQDVGWSLIGSWVGPAGADGPVGPTGATGPQGPQGIQGPQGPEGPVLARLGATHSNDVPGGHWNYATETGWYASSTAGGAPGTDWYIAHVVAHNASWVTQEAWQFTAGNLPARYRRHCVNGAWQAWYRVDGPYMLGQYGTTDVGQHVLAMTTDTNAQLGWGGTHAGSGLHPVNVAGQYQASTMPGTWRAHGVTRSQANGDRTINSTLWQRIA